MESQGLPHVVASIIRTLHFSVVKPQFYLFNGTVQLYLCYLLRKTSGLQNADALYFLPKQHNNGSIQYFYLFHKMECPLGLNLMVGTAKL